MSRRKLTLTYGSEANEVTEFRETKRRKIAQDPPRKRKKYDADEDDESDFDSEDHVWVPISALDSDLVPQSFEDIISLELPELIAVRERYFASLVEVNHLGQRVRPLSNSEVAILAQQLEDSMSVNVLNNLLLRKLKLDQHRRRHSIPKPNLHVPSPTPLLSALSAPPPGSAPDPSIIDGLTMITTTPYASSFASRLARPIVGEEPTFLHRDWTARSYWIDLMEDIQEHYSLSHPEREQSEQQPAPIDYQTLRPSHLPQVHDLLDRTFWPGIDVSDALQYSPQQCTVVATYKHLVVGTALLFSPQETYITYLAVRAGWESSHIATKMLHTLLKRNPTKDILLHVSVNNPAMLLYNRFGFKAEEFIVGFYEDYLHPRAKESRNAFRLRLRR